MFFLKKHVDLSGEAQKTKDWSLLSVSVFFGG